MKTLQGWLILKKAEMRPGPPLGYYPDGGCYDEAHAHWSAFGPWRQPYCWAAPPGQVAPPAPVVPVTPGLLTSFAVGRGWRCRNRMWASKVRAIFSLSSWHGKLIVCHWLYAVARLCVCPIGWPEKFEKTNLILLNMPIKVFQHTIYR